MWVFLSVLRVASAGRVLDNVEPKAKDECTSHPRVKMSNNSNTSVTSGPPYTDILGATQ